MGTDASCPGSRITRSGGGGPLPQRTSLRRSQPRPLSRPRTVAGLEHGVQPLAHRLLLRGAGTILRLAAIDFDDVEQAIADVHWAKENGLGGVLMPPLHPNAKFFFDPALDPVWAACQETGLPLGQHGGTGSPKYEPQSFASFMVLATEHSFFSGRSLWQLILGGTFDRFPELKIAYIETEQWWLGPVMDLLDRREQMGDDWTDSRRRSGGSSRTRTCRVTTGARTASSASRRSPPNRSNSTGSDRRVAARRLGSRSGATTR